MVEISHSLISGLRFVRVEQGQHAERGWELQIPRHVAWLPSWQGCAWPGSSPQLWPWPGEDIHEGHPDTHRNNALHTRNHWCGEKADPGWELSLVLLVRAERCQRWVRACWRGARPSGCCSAGGRVCRLYNPYIIRALYGSCGWEEPPAVKD